MPVKWKVCFRRGEVTDQWVAWCRPLQMTDSLTAEDVFTAEQGHTTIEFLRGATLFESQRYFNFPSCFGDVGRLVCGGEVMLSKGCRCCEC
jgi:hypothetical protein